MALILCCILGIAGTSAAIPLNLLDPEQSLTPAVQPPSRISHSTNQSWEASNSTSAVSAPFTLCYKESQGSALIADQCVEALVNSDFARLPPTEVLTFAPRSSPALAGQFELPRRYQSCTCSIVLAKVVFEEGNGGSVLIPIQPMANAQLNLPFR